MVKNALSYAFDIGDENIILLSPVGRLEEYQSHIAQTREGFRNFSLCGQDIQNLFCFNGLDHAFNNAAGGGRLTCCPACAAVAVAALQVR